LLIVGGLYSVLWGKSKEVDNNKVEDATDDDDDEAIVMPLPPSIKNDMEMQSYMPSSNGNGH